MSDFHRYFEFETIVNAVYISTDRVDRKIAKLAVQMKYN
jgi:hypothetical protein